MRNQTNFIQQLDKFITEYEALAARSQYDDLSDLHLESASLATRLQAAFDRMTSPNDTYGKAAERLRSEPMHVRVVQLSFLAYAFRDDLKSGWLDTITELVHAETTTDILQIAQDLLDANYKDAAAVIAGTALELHLRALCIKEGVDVDDAKSKPRKADQLRSDLHSKTSTTTKPQDRRISYWLTVRNEAAHGDYGSYTPGDVSGMLTEIKDFLDSMPA